LGGARLSHTIPCRISDADRYEPNPYIIGMRCVICGKTYPANEPLYVCPDHGNEGLLDILYDTEAARKALTFESREALDSLQAQGQAGQGAQGRQAGHGGHNGQCGQCGMWRYRAMLPVSLHAPVPPLLVGGTPLVASPRLAKQANVASVHIKDDSRQPTGSFKDRASALAVTHAKLLGARLIATASTGNAAAALAGMAASMDIPAVIFVPVSAPKAKIAQLLAYGAHVCTVEGSYDQAFDLCMTACAEKGWYNRNTAYNPYMAEGKKTAAYEWAEQSRYTLPDVIVLPVGDGCIMAGIHKGFVDLHALGLITHIPRLIGVQAAGSDFLMQAFENNEDVLTKAPISTSTIADSIAAGLPRDRIKAMRAIKQTEGAFVRVSDEAILEAIPYLAATTGIFAEPAAAAAWAGVIEARATGHIKASDHVGILITGSGLKDIAAVESACATLGRKPLSIEPTREGLESFYEHFE